ncbi:MAG: hypothetical protein Q4E88_02435 [Coriobacteriia bacterium]|nr:hypothetical protein [Coriobacteriia bacterium]
MKKIILALSCLSLVVLCSCTNSHLNEPTWSDDVKAATNTFIDEYGCKSPKYEQNSYVVFDFDNTTSINDICNTTVFYQLMHMAFNVTPTNRPSDIKSGLKLNDPKYDDYTDDIAKSYTYLYNTYGPFNSQGVKDSDLDRLHADPQWQEFCGKYLSFMDYISEHESKEIDYVWVGYSCYNMTKDEEFNLAKKALETYSKVESYVYAIETPSSISSKIGSVKTSMDVGVSVTPNIKELMRELNNNGIDVWINSASPIEIVRAAVEVFDLKDSVSGFLGITYKYDNAGRMCDQFDVDSGPGYIKDNGNFVPNSYPIKTVTEGKGKVNAIKNSIYPIYNKWPLAGFMDNSGDFNFCTEFDSLKLVICFNLANRDVNNGAGLIAELAVYQKENLHYDLKSANAAGDTLYVLQGRDENGMRSFRNSNSTIKLEKSEEKLFKGDKNYAQLAYMRDNNMTTADILNRLSIKNSNGWGFLDSYDGYHNIKTQ